ncbi:MAG: hypothetical protein HOE26_11450 [Rhodospirillaceae bacterium]|jgi:hypothetical protein|nr:hypothetical protein [Rhodospirillaceae bacterium]
MTAMRLIILSLVLAIFCANTQGFAATKKIADGKVAFLANLADKKASNGKSTNGKRRYMKPGFIGKSYPQFNYREFTLIGTEPGTQGIPSNDIFFDKVREAIDLIAKKSPEIFQFMQDINPKGKRIIAYTGKIGPASFASWDGDYVVNISVTGINEDPVFENSPYSLASSMVHELAGHGSQENDDRLWAMYDWCGKDSSTVKGVLWQANHTGSSSGFVEYEANLYARWFLETVRGTYPDLIEPAVRRYVKTVRIMKKRFPGWYDERKDTITLLAEFGAHFGKVCPEQKFTPHTSDN